MDKRIVFKNADGSCGIIIPSENYIKSLLLLKNKKGDLLLKNVDSCLVVIAKKDVPTGLPWRVVTTAGIPSERLFRGAWTDDLESETVDVDIPKARGIAHGIRRVKRGEAFKPNLEIINKASMGIPLGAGEDSVVAMGLNKKYKEEVDDVIQVGIESAQTEEELINVIRDIV